MAVIGRMMSDRFGSKKDARKARRKTLGSKAWIRLDGGFALRPCMVADLSDTGVQIVVDAPQSIPNQFRLLLSRDAGMGRNCRVKWRRGSQIGAEFL